MWLINFQKNSGKLFLEDNLQLKYIMMQDMFSSTHPVSVLALRGDDQDDPDLFPVVLPVDLQESTRETLYSNDAVSGISNILSPSNSSFSNANSQRRPPERQMSNFMSQEEGMEWSNTTLTQLIKVKKGIIGYIKAIIDLIYSPPAEHPPKPSEF
jgi:hypothetical protein